MSYASLLAAGVGVGAAVYCYLRTSPRKRIVSTQKAPAAIGPYSQAVVHGATAYVSGCIGLLPDAPTPTLAEGGISAQTHQALKNMKQLVEACGGTMDSVLKCSVLLSGDMAHWAVVNKIYSEYFPESPPARAAFAVAALPANALIEIECVVAV